jgi:hypothetical protein
MVKTKMLEGYDEEIARLSKRASKTHEIAQLKPVVRSAKRKI